jgi:hypothetical protein
MSGHTTSNRRIGDFAVAVAVAVACLQSWLHCSGLGTLLVNVWLYPCIGSDLVPTEDENMYNSQYIMTGRLRVRREVGPKQGRDSGAAFLWDSLGLGCDYGGLP